MQYYNQSGRFITTKHTTSSKQDACVQVHSAVC